MLITKSRIYEKRIITIEKLDFIKHRNFKLLEFVLSKNKLRKTLVPYLEKSVMNSNLSLTQYFLNRGAVLPFPQTQEIKDKKLRKYMTNRYLKFCQESLAILLRD